MTDRIAIVDNGRMYSDHTIYFVRVASDDELATVRRAVASLAHSGPWSIVGVVRPDEFRADSTCGLGDVEGTALCEACNEYDYMAIGDPCCWCTKWRLGQ